MSRAGEPSTPAAREGGAALGAKKWTGLAGLELGVVVERTEANSEADGMAGVGAGQGRMLRSELLERIAENDDGPARGGPRPEITEPSRCWNDNERKKPIRQAAARAGAFGMRPRAAA
jgi:hypothetical protein